MDKYISVKEIEDAALPMLPKATRDYYKSGATDEQTLEDNREAFKRLRIRPKCLVGVGKHSTLTTVLGHKVSIPIGIAPTAMQRMAHPEGELANARAAHAEGTVFILSTLSTSSLEEVAEAVPDAIKWFQLYIYNDREVTKNLVQRAEKAGFKAIVLTVDTPLFGLRRADVKNKFTLPKHLKLANFEGQLANKINKTTGGSGLNEYVENLFDKTLTWADIKWLKTITNLPIVAKGIVRGDDAVAAMEAGCAAILVSNHGARQLDDTPATIEILPEIIQAVKPYNIEVYLDGGVITGNDVYKALAIGARMVFVGRPALWGLTVGGQSGVQKVLNILKTELQYTLQIAACTCQTIKRQTAVKYLGLLFDQHMSFAPHITTLAARVRKVIYVMKRLRDCASPEILRMVFHALAQSIIQYGVGVWGCAAKSHMLLLERAQRAVIKVMLRKPFRYPTNLLYQETKFLRVRQLFIIRAVERTHSDILGSGRHEEMLRRRIYKLPLPPYRSTLARRSPAYSHSCVYNYICNGCDIKRLSVFGALRLVRKWLLTQSYKETEELIKFVNIR